MIPALSPDQAVAVLHRRYPEALVCTRCAVLLATRKESYAKSGLSEIERLEYICHECRQEMAEAARVAEVRTTVARENLVKAREAREALRARQEAERGVIQPLIETVVDPIPEPLSDAHLRDTIFITRELHQASTRLRKPAGRPKVHVSEEQIKRARRDRQRAYRARHKVTVTELA